MLRVTFLIKILGTEARETLLTSAVAFRLHRLCSRGYGNLDPLERALLVL